MDRPVCETGTLQYNKKGTDMEILKASVQLQFTGMILGGFPSDPLQLAHANERRDDVGAPPVTAEDIGPASEEVVVEESPKSRLVFRRWWDSNAENPRCAVDEHAIKGVLRDTLRRQALTKKYRGLVLNVHTDPYLIPFVYAPDSLVEEARMFQAITPMGPRNVVIIHEAIIKPVLLFTLEFHIAEEKFKDTSLIKGLMEYAGRYVGMGGGRGKSGLVYEYGLFRVVEWDDI
jgi:hypothetical protein